MLRKIPVLLAITLWSSGSLLLPKEAFAQTPLTRAVIQSLRNQVRLIPKNQSARPARTSDAMSPGDALATAKSSTAQLRFNDGSLARLGEQAVFKFNPGSRTLDLSNGTALVLIPPKQGTTRVRTPNAAAGIRGSALFVRYIPETDTTIVGALTTSGIEVFNEASSQRQELKAGNMAVIVKDRIENVYEFDLKTFYQTSELVSGLNLTKSEPTPSVDEAIAQVQEETFQALQEQSPLVGTQVVENPNFIQLSVSRSEDFPRVDSDVINDNRPSSRQGNLDLPGNPNSNARDVRTLLQTGEFRNNQNRPQFPGGGNTGGNFPGGGNTGGNFPGGGNTGGNFPGGGNTGGNFPGGGNTQGNFPGGGNTQGNFPGGGNTQGNFPGGGNTQGNFPGGGNTQGNFPGGGNTQGNFPGGGNTQGNFPGGGNTRGIFPGGGNTRGIFPGGGNTVNDDLPSSVNTPPNSRGNNSNRRINTQINIPGINTQIEIPAVDRNVSGTVDIPTITPAPTQ